MPFVVRWALTTESPPYKILTDEFIRCTMNAQTPEILEEAQVEPEKASRESTKSKSTAKKKSVKKSKNPLAESYAKRRQEIWGVLTMLLSVLFLISLFCYSIEDEVLIENISLFELFSEVAKYAATKLRNPLGLVGAKLSSFLMRSMFGYPTSILLVISAFWGWLLFRRQSFSKAIYPTVYGALFTTIFASMFGLTDFGFSEVMSGAIGRMIASALTTVLGKFGAWCVLSVLMVLVVALFIDLDLQKTFDRVAYLTRDKANEIATGATLKFKEWLEARESDDESEDTEIAESNLQPNAQSQILQEREESSIQWGRRKEDKPLAQEAKPIEVAVKTSEPLPVEINQAAIPESKLDLQTLLSENAKPTTARSVFSQTPPLALTEEKIPLPVEVAPIEPQINARPSNVENTEIAPSSTPELEFKREDASPIPNSELQSSEPPISQAQSSSDTTLEAVSIEPLVQPLSIEALVDEQIDKLLVSFEVENASLPNVEETALETARQIPLSLPEVLREEKDEVLDELLAELTSPKPLTLLETKQEPQVVLKESIQEKEADLDERKLEVETKEHFTYQFPSVDLLNEPEPETDAVSIEELEENKRKLLEKLRIYKIEVLKVEATVGPRVTLFELELAPDVKVSRITALADDLAMAMAARGIRIIAPIPGKNAVGVEIPNSKSKMVSIKSLLQSEKFKNFKGILPIAFGKTISNEIYIDDLAKMPHLLVAGATGSGKSVGINTILTSLIYFCSPEKVKFLLIDPKRVELFPYQKLKNHFLVRYKDLDEQIITDTSKAVYALKSIEKEMDMRYDRLAKVGVRNIKDFNAKFPNDELPYIVVVIDELADMMITAGKDVEEPIARLAQLARAVGIHLVVATQRPSVDVITGVIKANFPARIAYQVASKIDSRTILDMMGAEQLLGLGDMLYLPSSEPKPIRIQNAFVSTGEVEAITEFIYAQKGFDIALELPAPDLKLTSSKGEMDDEDDGDFERDKMFEEAAKMVVRHQQGSVSLLQRRLKLGFGRAARIMDQLEQAGIVGAPDGSKPREVLVENEESLALLLNNLD